MTDIASLDIRIRTFEAELAARRLRDLERAARAAERAAERQARAQERASRAISGLSRDVGDLLRNLGLMARGFLAVAAAQAAVQVLVSVDKAVIGISKTTGIVGEDLQRLEGRLKQLALGLGTPLEELLNYAKIAGQLGVRGAANISKFADTIAKLSISTADFQGEDAAIALAQLLNVTGGSAADVDKLASQIVRLGNNMAVTEGKIINAARFIGQATAAFGLSAEDVLALSGAVASAGQRAETSGTGFARLLQEMDRLVKTGGPGLESFAKAANTTGDEIVKAFNTNKVQAIQLVLSGAGQMIAAGARLDDTFARLGVTALESQRVLGPLASRASLFAGSLVNVREESGKTDALLKESSKAAESLEQAFGRLRNAVAVLIDNVGDRGLTGVVKFFVNSLAEALVVIGAMPGALTQVTAAGKAFAAVLTALTIAIAGLVAGRILGWLGSVIGAFKAARVASFSFVGALATGPRVLASLGSGIGALIGLVYGLATAFGKAADEGTRIGKIDIGEEADATAQFNKQLDFAKKIKDVQGELQATTGLLDQLKKLGAELSTPQGFLDFTKSSESLLRISSQLRNLGVQLKDLPARPLDRSVPLPPDQLLARFEQASKFTGQKGAAAFEAQPKVLDDLVQRRIKELVDQISELELKLGNLRNAAADPFQKGDDLAQKYLQTLRDQNEVLQKTADEGELAGKILQAQQRGLSSLGEEQIKDKEAYLFLIAEEVKLMDQLEAKTRVVKDRKSPLDDLREELQLLRMMSRERRVQETLNTIRDRARSDGASPEGADAAAEAQRGAVDAMVQLLEVAEQLRGVGEDIGSALGNALKRALVDGAKLRDVLRDLFSNVVSATFDRFVTSFLADLIGSVFASAVPLQTSGIVAGAALKAGGVAAGGAIVSAAIFAASILRTSGLAGGFARGGAFAGGGPITAFASGGIDRGLSAGLAAGVVASPTMVPMALIGEGTRPEAIMPLDKTMTGQLAVMADIGGYSARLPIGRLGDGNLGVKVSKFATGGVVGGSGVAAGMAVTSPTGVAGQARQGGRTTVNVYQTITTPNPDAFRSSQSQLMASTKRASRGIF